MNDRIPLLIELLAFIGFICCILIFDANIPLLALLFSFVVCELILELFHLRLKATVSIMYTSLYIIGATICTLISNGFQFTSFFPILFMTALLLAAQASTARTTKSQQRAKKEARHYKKKAHL